MSFNPNKSRFLTLISAMFYIAIIFYAAFMSFRLGHSQYLTNAALLSQNISKLSESISLDSTNPEAYKFRGILYLQNGNYQAAENDFRNAINLRSNDYLLWLQLGFTNNKLKNFSEAKNAYEKSILLAPNYFQNRQYLGFLYLRYNKPKPAFAYLSQAAHINPTLLPDVLQLAYQTFLGNPETIENLVQLNTVEAKKEMANFFINNNIVTDKTINFLKSGEINDQEKNQFINQLIKIKNFKLAFSIWTSIKINNDILQNSDNKIILNGDFENSILSTETGFGWQIQNLPNTNLKLDNKNPFTGSFSLKIIFAGKSDTASPIISQLVIIKPNKQYRLEFASRAEEMVSGGLPKISIIDADSGNIIAQSMPLSSPNNLWQNSSLNFKTGEKTQALILKIQRSNCNENACPIFGRLWLDNIKLVEF